MFDRQGVLSLRGFESDSQGEAGQRLFGNNKGHREDAQVGEGRGSGRMDGGSSPLDTHSFNSGVRGHGWKWHHSSACLITGVEGERAPFRKRKTRVCLSDIYRYI